MKAFKDLDFEKRFNGIGYGLQAQMFFENGYGVSVIKSDYSYGGRAGKYEMAVLKGKDGDSSLCYETTVTDDVLGHLDPKDVSKHMQEVQELK